jgi:hypothetical protein
MKSIQHMSIAFLVAVGLAACGGGGSSGSSGNDPPPANRSPGGIWTTQYTVTSGPTTGDTIKAAAIVTENGDLYFAARDQNNGCATVGFGQASVTGNSISGNIDLAFVQYTTTAGVTPNCTYADGSTSGTGTISGTVSQRSSMTLTVSGTTSMGMALGPDTYTWSFSSLYDTASSLATIAGNYTDGPDTLSIDGNGVIFEQDPATGCVINGQVALINAQYNAYSASITYSSCTGTFSAANGLTYTGLATLDQTVSPAVLDFGLSTSANGNFAVFIGQVTKQ